MAIRNTSGKPNVIVFLTDQQRWDCSSLHGNPLDLMPTFDRMAQEGTHVANSFTTQPVCGPARSTLQLGRYPTNTGVWKNGPTPDADLPSLAQSFAQHGYTTAYVGKWHLYDYGDGDPGRVPGYARLGYQHWLASNILEFTSDAYQTELYDEQGEAVSLYGYRSDACTDAVIRKIVELAKGDQPFFTFLSLIEPHHQNSRDDYPAPYAMRQRYENRWVPPDLAALQHSRPGATPYQQIAGYYGMVKRIDDALARLQDVVRSLGILDNTIILFTSDHGCHFKTRNSEYKRSLHDSSIRIPTMFYGGPFTGGGEIDHLVSHVDIPPTLLDVCGIPVPDSFEGRSILPLIRSRSVKDGECLDPPWQDDVYIQISEAEIGRAIRTKRWKYGVRAPGSFETAVAYEQPSAEVMQEVFLYDLYADPYELNNLVGMESHRELCKRLRKRLIDRMSLTGEPVPKIIPPDEIAPAGQLVVPTEDFG